VDEHRRRKDELVNAQVLQSVEKPLRAFNGHLLVQRTVLAGEVVEGG